MEWVVDRFARSPIERELALYCLTKVLRNLAMWKTQTARSVVQKDVLVFELFFSFQSFFALFSSKLLLFGLPDAVLALLFLLLLLLLLVLVLVLVLVLLLLLLLLLEELLLESDLESLLAFLELVGDTTKELSSD